MRIARARRTSPARLARMLRGDLDRIVSMALRKEPERRYASASLLAEDIHRYLSGRPVHARGDSTAYRAAKFVRRHRMAVTAAAAVVALLSGYASLTARHAAAMQRAAEQARLEAATAGEVSDFLVSLFEASDPDIAKGREVTGRELLDRGLRRADLLSAQPVVQARLLHAIGWVHHNSGQFREAQAIVGRALEVSRAALGEEHADVGRGYRRLGAVVRAAGDVAASERLLRRALEIDRAASGSASEDVAADLFELGYTLVQGRRLDEGEGLLRESLALRRALLGDSHPAVAESLSGIAFTRNRQGHPRDAAALYREALTVRIARLGGRHPEVARGRQNLAATLGDLGEFTEARRQMLEALEAYRAVFGDAHPSIAVTLNNLGMLARDEGNLEEAERRFRESAAMRRELLGDDHPLTLRALANIGAILMDTGRLDESVALHRQIIEAQQRTTGQVEAMVRANLAEVLRRQGNLVEAEALARAALAERRRSGSRTLDEASFLATLGRTLADRKAYDEAAQALQLSLEIRRERLGETHPSVVRTRGYLEALPGRGPVR
jgi:serine/threonine-protein kinase